MATFPVQHFISYDTREAGSPSDFTHRIYIPACHNRIALVAAQIPKSYYLVKSGHNTIECNGKTYTLPVGNYTYRTFATELPLLVAAEDGKTTLGSVLTVVTTNTTRDGKIGLTATGPMTIQWSAALGPLFGYATTATMPVTLSTSTTYGPNVVNFAAISQCWVLSSAVAAVSAGEQFSGVLSHFFVNESPDLSYVQYQNPAPRDTGKQLAMPSTQREIMQMVGPTFAFRLCGDDGSALELNGLSPELVLVTWREDDLFGLVQNAVRAWATQARVNASSM